MDIIAGVIISIVIIGLIHSIVNAPTMPDDFEDY
jgi:hypothetical protein